MKRETPVLVWIGLTLRLFVIVGQAALERRPVAMLWRTDQVRDLTVMLELLPVLKALLSLNSWHHLDEVGQRVGGDG